MSEQDTHETVFAGPPSRRVSQPPRRMWADRKAKTDRKRDLRGDTRGYMLRRLLVVADVAASRCVLRRRLYGGLGGDAKRSLLLDFALHGLSRSPRIRGSHRGTDPASLLARSRAGRREGTHDRHQGDKEHGLSSPHRHARP